jgi:pimeloyl-ACP methyl ester carboxylesterase
MTTFMLVHGGGCGAWIWRWVAPALRERGHDVFTTTMTGAGDRRHLLTTGTTIEANVADITNALVFEDLTDTILVGHSQGGAMLPGVSLAVADRIRSLLFLDAVLLRTGETVAGSMDYLTGDQCADLAAKVRRGEAPMTMDVSEQQQSAEADMSVPVDPARLQWMFSRLTPIPTLTMVEPVEVGCEAVTLPAVYAACASTPMTRYQARAKECGWPILPVDSDHAVMVSEPEKAVELLASVAAGAA